MNKLIILFLFISTSSAFASYQCRSQSGSQLDTQITVTMNRGGYRVQVMRASYFQNRALVTQNFTCRHTAFEAICTPVDPASKIATIEVGSQGTVFTTRTGRGVENFTDCHAL